MPGGRLEIGAPQRTAEVDRDRREGQDRGKASGPDLARRDIEAAQHEL